MEQVKSAVVRTNKSVAQIYLESKLKNELPEEEEYGCSNCNKTFSNVVALKNHRRVQHCLVDSESTSYKPVMQVYLPDDTRSQDIVPSGEREIESAKQEPDAGPSNVNMQSSKNPHLATEDVSFIMVKIRDVDKSDKRMDGTPKKPEVVSLTGPFKCMQTVAILNSHAPCGETFNACCEYSHHFYEHHSKKRRTVPRCQVCEKRLDQDSYSGAENEANVHTCSSCGETFLEKFLLEVHMRNHQKPKPYLCSLCSKKFSQPSSLQQHLRLHSGDRPYKCTYCVKAFTQKAGLQQHIRTHTNFKPFECVVCFKKFTQSIHLKQHMRTHTNITPFECTVCGKKFKQPSHLNFHLRAHANDFTRLPSDQKAKLADLLSKEAKFSDVEIEYGDE